MDVVGESHAQFNPSQEVTVQQLLTFLLRDLLKTKHYRRLPMYVLFLVFLTLLPMLTAVGDFRYNEAADHNAAVSLLFRRTELQKISTQEEFWFWVQDAVSELWVRASSEQLPSAVCREFASEQDCFKPCFWLDGVCLPPRQSRPNIALGFVLLRQWRVREAAGCTTNSNTRVLPPRLRSAVFDSNCTLRYSSDAASTETFGNRGQFVSDKTKGIPITGRAIHSTHQTFDTDKQFSERLAFTSTLQETQNHISELSRSNWLTPETRCVALSAVIYNRDIESFVSVDTYVVMAPTGTTQGEYTAHAFPILHLDDHTHRFLFVLDIVHLIFVPVLIYSIARTVRDQASWLKIPGSSAIGLWDVYEMVQISFHAVVCTYRVLLWAMAFRMSGDSYYDGVVDPEGQMFNDLGYYGDMWSRCWAWFAAVLILAFLRAFKYLQYNDRLCVLSETVRTAAGDLAGLFIILFVVLSAYSIGGTMLFGSEIDVFSSFTTTFFFLTQVLFAGEIVGDRWDIMFNVHPLATPLFMLSYLLISWMVLLNMVIAALSNAFILVVSQQAMHRKSTASGNTGNSLWKVVKRGFKKMWERMRGDDELENLNHSVPGTPSSPVSPNAAAARSRKLDYFVLRQAKRRFAAVQSSLKNLAANKARQQDLESRTLQEKLQTVAVSWGEIAASLRDVMPPNAMQKMFVRVHKFIASNDFHDLSTLTTKYYTKLSSDVEELLQILRTQGVGGKDGGGVFAGGAGDDWQEIANANVSLDTVDFPVVYEGKRFDDAGATSNQDPNSPTGGGDKRTRKRSVSTAKAMAAVQKSAMKAAAVGRMAGAGPQRRPRFGSEFSGARSSLAGAARNGGGHPLLAHGGGGGTGSPSDKERVALEYGGTWFPAFLDSATESAGSGGKWFSEPAAAEDVRQPLLPAAPSESKSSSETTVLPRAESPSKQQ